MAANSDASDGAAPNRPSIAPARAVVLTSLIQLVAIAMNVRLRHRRSLRAIERNLADSDPSLTYPRHDPSGHRSGNSRSSSLHSPFWPKARKGAGLRRSRPGRCARWRDGWQRHSNLTPPTPGDGRSSRGTQREPCKGMRPDHDGSRAGTRLLPTVLP